MTRGESDAEARGVRVCIVGPSPDLVGGQAIQARRLVESFASVEGIQVDFLPVNPRLPGPLGVLRHVKYLRTVATFAVYVASLLLHVRRFDVLHVFSASYWSFVIGPLPAILAGHVFARPVLLNYRSGEAEDHLANWRSARWGLAQATRVIVPSGFLQAVFERHGFAAKAIPNFVDLTRFRFRPREPLRPVFLSNRNFEALYNVSCTLRAFARIQARFPEASLTIVGDGPQRAELEALSSSLGLRRVDFVGAVAPDRMPSYYDGADIYLNTSDIDNMPTSIIEAFASGIAVVTTDAGGIPFVVRHGENGRMVSRGDAGAVAAQACDLLDDPASTLAMTRRARKECETRYVWPVVRLQWEETYRDLAESAALPGRARH